MKRGIWLLFFPVMMMLSSAACSGGAKTPTTSPLEGRPTVEVTAPASPSIETPKPAASIGSLPTQTLPPFTESGGDYGVNLTPADFVDMVDNPYFPLPPGTKWEFEIREGNGSKQTDTLEVLKDKRDVNGVQATVVRDTVSSGDQIVEDTFDWFAQDKYGNVWYVGESVDNYVGGVLVGHAGSWEWGVDGALPGIIMWADPSAHIDEEYHQEYYVGKAEDMGSVLSVDESLSVPFGSFERVVKTLDFSHLETNAQEQKFYAPGIGLIEELDVNTNEEMVLTKMTPPVK
ncbi:MAG TPA: hypothetical protein VK249_33615 [Anaerolineales bacterium]|nr:hypothetical protein [Anaerolineales bacterium]